MRGLTVTRDVVAGRPFRWWSAGHAAPGPAVVFVPGLGAPGYLGPWARATSQRTAAHVLDVPGWRWGRARTCAPTLDGVAEATISWVEQRASAPVVVVGHSTGSQSVLRAAAARPDLFAGVVLAGPTFAPTVRTLPRVAIAAIATIARERPRELPAVLPSYLHSGGRPLLRFLLDGLRDRPEQTLAGLRPPVLIVTGEHDGFAPPSWAATLAGVAACPHVVLPGAHNCCFPYPEASDAVLALATSGWFSGPASTGPH